MSLQGNYVATVPQGTQQINNTQQQIETNFQDIQTLLSVNHGPMQTLATASPNEGLHTLISYYNQSNDPSTGSNDMAMYAKAVTGDVNLMELFVRYPNNGSVVQLTGSTTSSSSNGGTFTSSGYTIGYQYLSGGIKMLYGLSSCSVSGTKTTTITFPTSSSFPGFTSTPFHMEMCPYNADGSAYNASPYGQVSILPTSATTYSITIAGSSVLYPFYWYWLAIGI